MSALRKFARIDPGVEFNLGRELLASVVVFLVALPLCMGIAIASGVPPAAGLLTGIIGGIVVGYLAGSPLQVSGPAAGLAVLVLEFVKEPEHGLEKLGIVVIGAGAIQIIAALLRVGRWFRAASPSVIHGMLAGIGVLIFGSQFHVMIDDTNPREGGLSDLISIPEAIGKAFSPGDSQVHHLAAAVGLLTIVSLVLWEKFRPKALRTIPGALIGVVLGSVAAFVWGLDIQYISVPTDLISGITLPQLSAFGALLNPAILGSVLAFALIASAESLLCAAAVDRMHDGPNTDFDKELLAQGIGNSLCGLVGGLPMTGVIVRSKANVEAGGKTRWSAIFHGLWLLLLVLLLPTVLEMIPRASLAAILVFIGYRLVNFGEMKHLWHSARGEAVVFVVTLLAIVFTDLLAGVVIGLLMSAGRLLLTFSRVTVQITRRNGGTEIDVRGAATFISLPKLAEALESATPGSTVHLRFGNLAYIDHACMELIGAWQGQHQSTGGKVNIEWDRLKARADNKPIFIATEGDSSGPQPVAPPEPDPPALDPEKNPAGT